MGKMLRLSAAAAVAAAVVSLIPGAEGAVVGASQAAGAPSASVTADSGSKFLYRLLAAAQQQPNYGAAIEGSTRAITIFGVGYPTDRLESLIKAAPAHGVTAKWRRCPYTQEQLTDEAERLVAKHSYINRVGPNRNAFALIVGTTNKRLLSSYDPEALLGTSFAVKVVREGPAGSPVLTPN